MQEKSRFARFIGMAALAVFVGNVVASVEAATAPLQDEQQVRIVGSGKSATENRAVSGFQALSVGGIGTLTVTQGGQESLTVEADDNILPYIVTEVKDGRLRIGMKPHTNVNPKSPIHYRLTVRNLNRINLSGVIEGEMASLKADRLDLEVSGASKFNLASFEGKDLNLEASGASHVRIAGTVGTQKLQFSGATKYEADGLTSRQASVEASGACHVLLNAQEQLMVGASGASNVEYIGSPNIEKHTSGVSTVRKR